MYNNFEVTKSLPSIDKPRARRKEKASKSRFCFSSIHSALSHQGHSDCLTENEPCPTFSLCVPGGTPHPLPLPPPTPQAPGVGLSPRPNSLIHHPSLQYCGSFCTWCVPFSVSSELDQCGLILDPSLEILDKKSFLFSGLETRRNKSRAADSHLVTPRGSWPENVTDAEESCNL